MIVRLLTEHHLEFLSFKRRLQRLVRVYICQNVKFLEIPCTGSRLFIGHINGNHSFQLRSTSSNTQVIRNYGPQSRGTAEALIFWLQVHGMTMY